MKGKISRSFPSISEEGGSNDSLDVWGYRILGRRKIDDIRLQTELVSRLEESVLAFRPGEEVNACWMPRHAIRVLHKKETYHVVICFHCNTIRSYKGEKEIGIDGITTMPEVRFNEVLREAQVPLMGK